MEASTKITAIVAAAMIVLSGGTALVEAGAIVGATEFTQIANNMELLASGQLQISQYAQQVQQYQTQLQQYRTQLQHLNKFDPNALAQIVQIDNEIVNLNKLQQATSQLYGDTSTMKNKYASGWSDFATSNLSPQQYAAELLKQGSTRKASAENLLATSQSYQQQSSLTLDRIRNLQSSVNATTGMQESLGVMTQSIALSIVAQNQTNGLLSAQNLEAASKAKMEAELNAMSTNYQNRSLNNTKSDWDAINNQIKGASKW